MMSRRKHAIFISAPHDGQVRRRALAPRYTIFVHLLAPPDRGFAERVIWNIQPGIDGISPA